MSPSRICVVAAFAALWTAAPAGADPILCRCGPNLCRMAPDGKLREPITSDGRPGGPAYSCLSPRATAGGWR